MEHILISPGKLKLMLTKDDLERYRLDRTVDDRTVNDCGCEASRIAFRALLDDAGRITGFDAGDGKLFIQLYPSKDGGAEIYITRLGKRAVTGVTDSTDSTDSTESMDSADSADSNGAESDGRRECSPDERVKVTRIGVFDTMAGLLECCRHLRSCCGGVASAAYCDGKRYFLVIGETLSYRDYLDSVGKYRIEAAFGEYGRNMTDSAAISYVKEHCFIFCKKNAVKMLADMV